LAEVFWTSPALDDLQNIIAYIAADSPAYACRLDERIVEAPRKLEDFPEIGRIVSEFASPTVRELIVVLVPTMLVGTKHHCRDDRRRKFSTSWKLVGQFRSDSALRLHSREGLADLKSAEPVTIKVCPRSDTSVCRYATVQLPRPQNPAVQQPDSSREGACTAAFMLL
jgi:plasmid stabilization system protein ParE